jgi:MoxR-like ATPase
LPKWSNTGNTLHRILLYGPAETGKSTIAHNLFPDREVVVIPNDEDTIKDDLLGTTQIVADGKGGTNSVWVDGVLTRAFRLGLPVIWDEIDKTRGAIRSLLYAVANDWPLAALLLPTGELVRPAHGFCIFATTNARPEVLPLPLQTRFLPILASMPPTEALESLPEEFRDLLRNTYASRITSGEYSAGAAYVPQLGMRSLKMALAIAEQFGRENAFEFVFGKVRGREIVSSVATM